MGEALTSPRGREDPVSPKSDSTKLDLLASPTLLEDMGGGIPLTKRANYIADMTINKYEGDLRETYGSMLKKTCDNRQVTSLI